MKIKHYILLALLAIGMASCGNYEKLLKSNDFDAQYRGALDYYKNKKYNKAIALFDAVEMMYTNTEREDTVKFYKAKAIYQSGDFISSGMLFDDFRRNFGRSSFLEEAEFLYAMSHYYMSPGVEQDQTSTAMAIIAIEEYLERYPNSPKDDECREMIEELIRKLHEKAYLSAKTYYDIEYYNSAILAFRNALKKYPDSRFREDMLFLIVRSNYLYAKNSVERKQRSRYLDMLDAYYNFISEYPESKYAKDARKMYDYAQKLLKAEDEGLVTSEKEVRNFDKQQERNTKREERQRRKNGPPTEETEAASETTE